MRFGVQKEPICVYVCVGIIVIPILIAFFFKSPEPVMILLFAGFVVYSYHKYKNDTKLTLHISELKKSGHYRHIQNFITHHFDQFNSLSGNWGVDDNSDENLKEHLDAQIQKLNELLSVKGISLEQWELAKILTQEYDSQKYGKFKFKLLLNKPHNLNDYLINFLDQYGDSSKEFTQLLEQLLVEKKVHYDSQALDAQIEKLRKSRELEHFEHKISGQISARTTISDLDSLSGHGFEDFLKQLFKKMGYSVEKTSTSHDQGADLILSKLGEKIVVQAKQYAHTVGNGAIQEVVGSIKHYNAEKGMVVTTSTFSKPAIALAKSNHIELIDRHKLKELIEKYF